MASTAVSSAPVTSWWYGQGGAVDVVRRLESLYALSPSPGPAGVVTARRDELTVTFVEGLKAPLPQPWRPAGRAAQIPWESVDPGNQPDPQHPVYLVAFGINDDGELIGLNLAAFSRVRIEGDPATAAALVSRWVLELLTTHPGITIGVTDDAWRGPLTTRVQPVAPSHVPDVDVLVCGAALTYAERNQIVGASTSPILLDLGQDAAVSPVWTITCGPDRLGQIRRGSSPARPMTATLIVPSADVVDRCADLLIGSPAKAPASLDASEFDDDDGGNGSEAPVEADDTDAELPAPDGSSPLSTVHESAPAAAADPADSAPAAGGAIDFFAPAAPLAAPASADLEEAPASEPVDDEVTADGQPDEAQAAPAPPIAAPAAAGPIAPAAITPAAVDDAVPETAGQEPADTPAPVIAPIWNHILGQVDLRPPHSTLQPGPREKRLNELTVFLQRNPWAGSADIIRRVYSGAASEKTVTQQVSMLRARLGVVRHGGPKALPPMIDGGYHLDNAVRSDWMEFERLVEILIETTPTPNLVAAMELVTGPPLGGIPTKEWAWTKDLRDELRDRVPAAAVVLARQHHCAKRFGAAVEIARKGLWYDNARQDLWEVALQAALDGHDKDGFRALRQQFLNTIPGPDREPAVFDLTGRAG
jgi:hypothetical protein